MNVTIIDKISSGGGSDRSGDLLFGVIWQGAEGYQINANGQWEDFNSAILGHKPVNFAFDGGRVYSFPHQIEAADDETVIGIHFADFSLNWLPDGTIAGA